MGYDDEGNFHWGKESDNEHRVRTSHDRANYGGGNQNNKGCVIAVLVIAMSGLGGASYLLFPLFS